MSSVRRPFAPRTLLRPVRLVVLGLVAGLLLYGLSDISMLRLPAGEPLLFDYTGGTRVLVSSFDDQRPPLTGDAVFYQFVDLAGERTLGFGRLVARAGDSLEIDPPNRRLRRSGGDSWYPATSDLLERLPLGPGQVLVMAENPLRQEAGAIVSERQLVGRVFAVLPF